MVTIEIAGERATITDGEWQADSTALADLLQSMLPALGFSPAEPDPDYAAAKESARVLGGKILAASEPEEPPAGLLH